MNGSRKPAGEPVWRRGHQLRGAGGNLSILPGPSDNLDEEDPDGPDVIMEGDEDPGEGLPGWLDVDPAPPPPPRAADEPGEPRPHAPPGHLRRPPPKTADGGKGPARITAGMRKDIHAKVRVVLQPAAELLAVRDKTCGPVAVRQEPAISDALTSIICDSPDLVAFFTGPAGGFMKYFELIIAAWPLVMTASAHHVSNRGQQVPAGDPHQPPQAPAFAA